MHHRRFGIATMLVVVLSLMSVALAGNAAAEKLDGADHGGRPFATELTGAAEVPGPGDPDGSGSAIVTINLGQGTVCWEIVVSDIAAPTAAHIHQAPVGVSGGVVVPLLTSGGGGLTGCTEADQALLKDILVHPEEYYVNVHTADFTAGAVRGQLG